MLWIICTLGLSFASELIQLTETSTSHDILHNIDTGVTKESEIELPSLKTPASAEDVSFTSRETPDDTVGMFHSTDSIVLEVGKSESQLPLSLAVTQLNKTMYTLIIDDSQPQILDRAIELNKTCFIQGKTPNTEFKIKETGPQGLFSITDENITISQLLFTFLTNISPSSIQTSTECVDTSFTTINGENATLNLQSLLLTVESQSSAVIKNSLITLNSGSLNIVACSFTKFVLNNTPLFRLDNPNNFKLLRSSDDKLCEFKDITRLNGNGTVFSVEVQEGDVFTVSNASFVNCEVKNGNGGAIYVRYNHGDVFIGDANDTAQHVIFQNCSASVSAEISLLLVDSEGVFISYGLGGAIYVELHALPGESEHLDFTHIAFTQSGTAAQARPLFVESHVDEALSDAFYSSLVHANRGPRSVAVFHAASAHPNIRVYSNKWYENWWVWLIIAFVASDIIGLIPFCICCGCMCCVTCCVGCHECCTNCHCRRRRSSAHRAEYSTPSTTTTAAETTNTTAETTVAEDASAIPAVAAKEEEELEVS